MHPQGPAAVALLNAQGWQSGRFLAAPWFKQQGGLGGEVDALLGGQGFEGCPGWLGAAVEPVLGQQQVEVGCFPPVYRQAARHVTLGGKLPHRIAVHQHFHHRCLFAIEMGGVASWQLHRR